MTNAYRRKLTLLIFSLACTSAAWAANFTVNNTDDSGPGSLRQAVSDAAASAGTDTIDFDSSLSGATVTLDTGEITFPDNGETTEIDASSLPAGIRVDGSRAGRIFSTGPTATVSVNRVTFANGYSADFGGGIENAGILTLIDCTLHDNFAGDAGAAIDNDAGTVTLTRCTLYNNYADYGAGIENYGGTVTLANCTLTGNVANNRGGAIYNENGGSISLSHCTLTENSAPADFGSAVASESTPADSVTITHSIVAGNWGSDMDFDDAGANPFTSGGGNLIGSGNGSAAFSQPGDSTGLTTDQIKLSHLGVYGGPTMTMPPLPGSPAIDAAVTSATGTDQRGISRPQNGDLSGSSVPDIGAVEAFTTQITTATDELDTPAGPNLSLREAVRDAQPGALLVFAPGLSGQTVTLGAAEGEIALSKSVLIAGTGLAEPITIDGGPGANRLFYLPPGVAVHLADLTLTGGVRSDYGGAIEVEASSITLTGCVLQGNTSPIGGAIAAFNGVVYLDNCILRANTAAGPDTGTGGGIHGENSIIRLSQCSLIENQATVGGGIFNRSSSASGASVHLAACTISGNSSTFEGAGFYNFAEVGTAEMYVQQSTVTGNNAGTGAGGGMNWAHGTGAAAELTLFHCTVVDNAAPDYAGGIVNYQTTGTSTAEISATIIAANTADLSPDISASGGSSTTAYGGNLIGQDAGIGASWHATDLVGSTLSPIAPGLAPLGSYGGPTQTMPPLPGSPALEIVPGVIFTTDQRGLVCPRDGNGDGIATADSGAVESAFYRVDIAADELETPAGAGDLSLREAIRDAPEGSIVTFAPALSGQTITLGGSGELSLAKSVLIVASGLAAPVTIHGGAGSNRLFYVPSDVTAYLAGLTLTGGNGTGSVRSGRGGALAVDSGGALHLANCTVHGNTAGSGGGAIDVTGGTLSLTNCDLHHNTAAGAATGGAISNENGLVTLTRCGVFANQANGGGGIYSQAAFGFRAEVTLTACTVSGNTCTTEGAGLYNYSGGGGAVIRLQQSTIAGNSAGSNIGGIVNWSNHASGSADLVLEYCTVAVNSALGTSGGVANFQSAGAATTSIQGTLIAGNIAPTAPDVFRGTGVLNTDGTNLIGITDGSNVTWQPGDLTGTGAAPLLSGLAPLGSYGGPTQTMPPLAGSPSIDPSSGATTAPFATDQRGFARLVGGIVDIGAAEAGPSDGPGTLAFPDAVVRVNEATSPALIPIARTNGIIGAVTVRVNSTPGTATSPADFGTLAAPGFEVTFASGETLKHVPVTLVSDPALKEPHENFTLTLSTPGGGAVLGAQTSTTVRIIDFYDAALPTLTLLTPKANEIILEAGGPNVQVTGAAKDDKGLKAVQVQLNGGPFVDANLTGIPVNHLLLSTNYNLTLPAVPGLNNLVVRAVDEKGKISALQKRSFTYRVIRPLAVSINGGANSGTVTAGFVPTSQRYAGISYKITATPKAGYVFNGWSATNAAGTGITTAAAELPALTFVMQPGLTLEANFILNPFTTSFTGTYAGLVMPSFTEPSPDGTIPGNHNAGLLSTTLTSTGRLTGTLKIDGASLPITAIFDNGGTARFGAARLNYLTLLRPGKPDFHLVLQLDMGGRGLIYGRLVQTLGNVTQSVSDAFLDRAHYNAKTKVPTALAGTASQRYNLHFPPYYPQYGLNTAQYPQGVGIGSMTINSTGTVTYAGTLADNTPFTASAALSRYHDCPLYVSLYTAKGCLAGNITADATETDSDATSPGFLWCRPAQLKVQWYPGGWPNGVFLNFVGSKYLVPAASAGVSVIPGLGAVNTVNGNALLTCMDGRLTTPLEFKANITTKNVVTKVPTNATNFTLALTVGTGEISGTFLHQDDKRPAFKASTFQKAGPYQGTYGFFLTAPTAPVNGLGQGGAVMLMPR